MSVVLLDASAAIRLVLSPVDHAAMLAEVEAASDVLAPYLFSAETGNALWKYFRAGKINSQALRERHGEAIGLVNLWLSDADLFPEALALAASRDYPI